MGITYSFRCLLSLCFSSLEGEVGLPWQAWAGKGLLTVPPHQLTPTGKEYPVS